jgi:hypothetical protein
VDLLLFVKNPEWPKTNPSTRPIVHFFTD